MQKYHQFCGVLFLMFVQYYEHEGGHYMICQFFLLKTNIKQFFKSLDYQIGPTFRCLHRTLIYMIGRITPIGLTINFLINYNGDM